jgi:N-formylglutamate deformylase
MNNRYTYHEGDSPLLVSVPHDGRVLPPDIAARMTPEALEIPDTDWHVGQLYEFCKDLNASMIVATHSRYVVDLNRSMSDEALYEGQVSTGLCPAQTFGGVAIYSDASLVTESEKESRVVDYWQPYHEKIGQRLQQLKDRFGYALLWDAHSIPSRVPSLFPGELTELNIGTNNGASCPQAISAAVAEVAAKSPYSTVLDGRFRGGFITRNYGSPAERQYAIQLELAQRSYMHEDTLLYDAQRAARLAETLQRMLSVFAESAAKEVS